MSFVHKNKFVKFKVFRPPADATTTLACLPCLHAAVHAWRRGAACCYAAALLSCDFEFAMRALRSLLGDVGTLRWLMNLNTTLKDTK